MKTKLFVQRLKEDVKMGAFTDSSQSEGLLQNQIVPPNYYFCTNNSFAIGKMTVLAEIDPSVIKNLPSVFIADFLLTKQV